MPDATPLSVTRDQLNTAILKVHNIESTPTASSGNAVTSGGVKSYVDNAVTGKADSADVTALTARVDDLELTELVQFYYQDLDTAVLSYEFYFRIPEGKQADSVTVYVEGASNFDLDFWDRDIASSSRSLIGSQVTNVSVTATHSLSSPLVGSSTQVLEVRISDIDTSKKLYAIRVNLSDS